MCKYGYLESKIGLLEIIEEKEKIIKISIVSKQNYLETETSAILNCKKQLLEYFSGSRKKFSIPIELKGTDFQKKVWQELLQIPYGKLASYSDIATSIGNSKAVRAVGGAIHNNPILIIVPCHRVIGKNGTLVGFYYGLEVKNKLIYMESR